MSDLTYLKGVRTRYRNILDSEITKGVSIMGYSVEREYEIDYDHQIARSSKCFEKLKLYNSKLEEQSSKLALAIEDSDTNLLEKIMDEDLELCVKATDCLLDLKTYKESLVSERDKEVKEHIKKDESTSKLIQLQRDMQGLIAHQMEQQDKLLAMKGKSHEKSNSVKLPKLDMISFDGDITRWFEFWDSFNCAVHTNENLSNVERFNYLKSKLFGEAHSAISGLSLSNENYEIAIQMLKERFGNVQDVVDLHYNKLINLSPPNNKTVGLRTFLNGLERHLRSLEVLDQDINQDVFVSIVRSKLPEDVRLQLELQNGPKHKWTIVKLREMLGDYIVARERAEQRKLDGTTIGSSKQNDPTSKPIIEDKDQIKYTSSAHALISSDQHSPLNNSTTNYSRKCRYCGNNHWSDECQLFKTTTERKTKLKGSCFRCLRVGHMSKQCRVNKTCVHCGVDNKHHRSLCPNKFNPTESVTHLVNEGLSSPEQPLEENVLMSSNELVLMQTALVDVENPMSSERDRVRLILDSGSHRTYISEALAKRLKLQEESEQEIHLVTFGNNKSQVVKTKCTTLRLKLKNGESITLAANIVPVISGGLLRKPVETLASDKFKYLLESVDLADTLPQKNESSSIELLIGNDYYLDLILNQKMELQPGLYLLASKLGWLVSGRINEEAGINEETNLLILNHGTNVTKTRVFAPLDPVIQSKPVLEDFWNVESIGIMDKNSNVDDSIALETFRDTVSFSEGRYQIAWPWKEEQPDLPTNRELALGRLKTTMARLKNKPDLLRKYHEIIQEQLDMGIIEKVEKGIYGEMVHYIPHHAVITPQKNTTKVRVVYDASAKVKNEYKSLNECLYRGPVMLPDLGGMLLRFRMHKKL